MIRSMRGATRFFLCVLAYVSISSPLYAADQSLLQAGYAMGDTCHSDSECFEGCRIGTHQVNCINASEGVKAVAGYVGQPIDANTCSILQPRPPGGLSCVCVPAAHVCGYAASGSGN